jgi:hypothetical protein
MQEKSNYLPSYPLTDLINLLNTKKSYIDLVLRSFSFKSHCFDEPEQK